MTQSFFNPALRRIHSALIKRLLRECHHGLQARGRKRAKLRDLQDLALIQPPLRRGGFLAQPTLHNQCVAQ